MTKFVFKKMGINGEGIAYDNNIPVFCDGVLPEEEADVRIDTKEERYKRASLREILKASPDRVTPVCPYQSECGGCALMHVRYEAQLNYKKQLLEEALWKYGHVNRSLVRDMHASPSQLGYRSSCKLPVQEVEGKLVTGMYKPNTNHFVVIDHCPAHTEDLEKARKAVLEVLNRHHLKAFDLRNKSGIRYLVLRTIAGVSQLTLVTGKDILSDECLQDLMAIEGMASVARSTNTRKKGPSIFGTDPKVLAGSETIDFEINGLTLQLSPESFFQLNIEQAEELYKAAVGKIDKCKTLVEAYCGVGAMSLLAKDKVQHSIGIEFIEKAVVNAAENAAKNNIEHASFITADAAEGFAKISASRAVDTLLVDPPRSGMDDALLEAVRKNPPKRIVYISCNPATLGKNLKFLKQCNYQVRTVMPFDLFPNTPHVESLTVLER